MRIPCGSKKEIFRFALLLSSYGTLASTVTIADPISDSDHHFSRAVEQTSAAQVDWKAMFAKIFAANIQADLNFRGLGNMTQAVINRSIYYSPNARTARLSMIRDAGSSNASYELTKAIHEVTPAPDLTQPIPAIQNSGNVTVFPVARGAANIAIPEAAKKLAAAIQAQKNNGGMGSAGTYNFFDTPAGKVLNDVMKDFIFVIVPGYASHTQPGYSFVEILEDANEHYQRQQVDPETFPRKWQRPRTPPPNPGGFPVFQPADEFHSSAKANNIGFDVVTPMGDEMGDSLGVNEPIAEKLGNWLITLLKNPKYASQNRKLILLGYSKGGPIIHEVVRWAKNNSPELHAKIAYLVTSNAVLQGAVPASNGLRNLRKELNIISPNDPVTTDEQTIARVADLFRSSQGDARLAMASALAKAGGFGAISLDNPLIAKALKRVGINDPEGFAKLLVDFSAPGEIERLLNGIKSMSASDMISWMLKNLRDENFAGKTIFNLSGITDIQDFLLPIGDKGHPDGFDDFGPIFLPSLVPRFGSFSRRTAVDWPNFSIDNLFLHLTSISGFQESPGGLYDAQVGWMDTKSIALDRRALDDTLTDDEIQRIAPNAQGNRDRSALVLPNLKDTSVVDFGDLRATHWNISFLQAFVPPDGVKGGRDGDYYMHRFPRRAYHAAIVETIAMYHLLSQSN
jgi:hypothetical protein